MYIFFDVERYSNEQQYHNNHLAHLHTQPSKETKRYHSIVVGAIALICMPFSILSSSVQTNTAQATPTPAKTGSTIVLDSILAHL